MKLKENHGIKFWAIVSYHKLPQITKNFHERVEFLINYDKLPIILEIV